MSPERKVEILPGFSKKNQQWAVNTKKELEEQGNIPAIVVYWSHWESRTVEERWIETEANKIAEQVGKETINILAKSVGTMVAMEVLKRNVQVDKLILCGIPIEDFQEDSKERYRVLKNVDANRVLVIQNDEDPHGQLGQVQSLMNEFNPNITIDTKHRDDHEYPYSDDFIAFLSKDKE
jgi:hypothetical protein